MVFGVNLFSLKKDLRQILRATHGIEGLDLENLNAFDNNKITDASFMKNLKYLNASGDCRIDQKGIKGLDLVNFYVDKNEKINNVSFMKNLKILHIAGCHCGINQKGLWQILFL